MITAPEVFSAVPELGAERALQVFAVMKGHTFGLNSIEAMARAILAYTEWTLEQSAETRMAASIKALEVAGQVHKSRFRSRARLNPERDTLGGSEGSKS